MIKSETMSIQNIVYDMILIEKKTSKIIDNDFISIW